VPSESSEKRRRGHQRLGLVVLGLALSVWTLPAGAEDAAQARSQPGIVAGDWKEWLDRWWVEPDVEWDSDEGEGVDLSIDAEIGHMVTDRLGFWGRPAYRADHEEQVEDWDFRFGVRYRFN